MIRPVGRALAALAAAAALAGCGSSGPPPPASTSGGPPMAVYASLPLHGPLSAPGHAVLDGIRLALLQAGGRAGQFAIQLHVMDDGSNRAGGWDPAATASDASSAVLDRQTVLYLGDLTSGASAISIPILNQGGIAQISPSSTYTGLTLGGVGARPGEPGRYYPAGRQTFVRLVSPDTVQATALGSLLVRQRCRRVAVANDGDVYGRVLASLIGAQLQGRTAAVSVDPAVAPTAAAQRAYARAVTAARADCFLYTGERPAGAAALYQAVAAALPHARLYGSSGVCLPGLGEPGPATLPPRVAARLRCTSPVLSIAAYPGGPPFAAAYRAAYGAAPSPYALLGYEAMELGLGAIGSLTDQSGAADSILDMLLRTHARDSPIGTYTIEASGDISVARYGLWQMGPAGPRRYLGALHTPAP